MTTITKTSAAAITRKLNALGFEAFDKWEDVGYKVSQMANVILVQNWTYGPSTAAAELGAAGYVIGNVETHTGAYTGRRLEMFLVEGKVGA